VKNQEGNKRISSLHNSDLISLKIKINENIHLLSAIGIAQGNRLPQPEQAIPVVQSPDLHLPGNSGLCRFAPENERI